MAKRSSEVDPLSSLGKEDHHEALHISISTVNMPRLEKQEYTVETDNEQTTDVNPQDTGTHSSAAPLSPSNEPKQDDPNPTQTTGSATRPCQKLISDHRRLENLDW